jgi:phage gp29-like protein
MAEEMETTEKNNRSVNVKIQNTSGDAVYGFGLIGAWVYYIGRAKTPEQRIKGFLKGLAWPAFMVYDLLVFLNKE